jgi:hypothetical protein
MEEVLTESFRRRLMPFQREGIEFGVQRQGRLMIADEVSVGGTIANKNPVPSGACEICETHSHVMTPCGRPVAA